MNPFLEQRKFVVPEVIVGYNASRLVAQYLKHFGAKKTMIVTDKGITIQDWFKDILAILSSHSINM